MLESPLSLPLLITNINTAPAAPNTKMTPTVVITTVSNNIDNNNVITNCNNDNMNSKNDVSDFLTPLNNYARTSSGGCYILLRLFLLGSIYTCLGVTNNLAFWAVGNTMPKYQSFLAYASCFFNPLVFLCAWLYITRQKRKQCADVRAVGSLCDEEMSKKFLLPLEDAEETTPLLERTKKSKHEQSLFPHGKIHLFAVIYGIFIAVNSICGMWSDSHIGGLLQNILNQFMLPIMAILSRICLKQKMTMYEIGGSVVVMLGSVFGVITSLNDNAGGPQEGIGEAVFWVCVYVLCIASLPPQSVLQQYVVAKFKINPIPLIFAGSFYAIVFSSLAVFLDTLPPFAGPGASLSQVIDTQQAAWQCIFGAVSADCGEGAWQLYLLYALSGALMAWIQMVLVAEESAMFFVIIDAVSVPITAISFCIPAFMGPAAESLTWQSLISVVIIMGGIVLFKMKEVLEAVSQRTFKVVA